MLQIIKDNLLLISGTLAVISALFFYTAVAIIMQPQTINNTSTNFIDHSQWQAMIVASSNELMFEPDHFIYKVSNQNTEQSLEYIKSRCTYWNAERLPTAETNNWPLMIYCLKKKTKAEYTKEK